jgi:glycosyltransferase involved in cell wall biosynthesis
MFGRGKGGIEQVFLDYYQALSPFHTVINIADKKGWAITQLPNNECLPFSNLGAWDPLAAKRLRTMLQSAQVDIIIAHGNRAITLAKKSNLPVIGIAHNYKLKHFDNIDAAFAITQDLKQILESQGINSVFHIPNMIAPTNIKPMQFHMPPIIGTMGRFVAKKGFDIFIKSLAELKKQPIEFRAVIGGDGEEKAALEALITQHQLSDNVRLIGWVEDKDAFFSNIDVFCLPSLHEPFGIVLLEAMARGIPCVVTDSEGPSEIAKHEHDALIASKSDPISLGKQLTTMLKTPSLAENIAKEGINTASQYTVDAIAQRINKALDTLHDTPK